MGSRRGQLELWLWGMRGNKQLYRFFCFWFVIGIPVLALVLRLGVSGQRAEEIYGYVSYSVRILLGVMSFLPLLVQLHFVFGFPSKDCVRICNKWSAQSCFFLSFFFVAGNILILMALTAAMYAGPVSLGTMAKDTVDYIVIVWILFAISHLVVKISENIYFALILTEMYSVIFLFMGVGMYSPINVFSVELLEGVPYYLRILIYVLVGLLLEVLAARHPKRRSVADPAGNVNG